MKPWASSPFELIQHAEEHWKLGSDFDRRMALISFDNSIEVSITVFISLHPGQREGLPLNKDKCSTWLRNYHTKIDFLEWFNSEKQNEMLYTKDLITYYHGLRNELYHGGSRFVPNLADVEGIRSIALWVFSILFNVDDIEDVLFSALDILDAPTRTDIDSKEVKLLKNIAAIQGSLDEILTLASQSFSPESIKRLTLTEKWEKYKKLVSGDTKQFDNLVTELESARNEITNDQIKVNDISQVLTESDKLLDQALENLKEHQKNIVKSLIHKTRDAFSKKGKNKIGVVHQTVGSGITKTLTSYVWSVLEDRSLRSPRFLIITDRVLLANQITHSLITDSFECSGRVVNPSTSLELISLLKDRPPEVIVTTTQKLSTIKNNTFNKEELIVVVFNVRATDRVKELLAELFPVSSFVGFTGANDHFHDGRSIFGDLIYSYDVKDGIEDGICNITSYVSLATKEFNDKKINMNSFYECNEDLSLVASSIIQCIEKLGDEKVIISVNNVDTLFKLSQTICEMKPLWCTSEGIDKRIQGLHSLMDLHGRNEVLGQFRDPRSPVQILLTVDVAFDSFNMFSNVKHLIFARPGTPQSISRAIRLLSPGDKPSYIYGFEDQIGEVVKNYYT